jgi:hypothetical protein
MRRQMPVLQRNFYELWPSRNHEGTTERRVVRSQLRKLLAMMREERAFYAIPRERLSLRESADQIAEACGQPPRDEPYV